MNLSCQLRTGCKLSMLSSSVFMACAIGVSAAELPDEITVIGVAPGSAVGSPAERLPFAVKSTSYLDLQNQQALDLTDYMNSSMGSVSINSAQNNPLQPDLQFRGFTASPLLGLPQGIAVYQNGVRINEPLGDAVNWDLLPESAVYGMDLISGANPVFGLNTLGGALAIKMKDGFNFTDSQLEIQHGSWGRLTASAETGSNFQAGNGDSLAYYLNASTFDEDGWRALSASDARNFYSSFGWRNPAGTALNLSYQHAESTLRGNGPLPVGMLAIDRSAVFTAPDITENALQALTLDGKLQLNDEWQLNGNVFWRENDTHSFNGDGSDLELCEFAGGSQALLEDADDLEDQLEDQLAVSLDEICAGQSDDIRSFDELQMLINQRAEAQGYDPDTFALQDVSSDIYGSGILSGEAINNMSDRRQTSRGFTLQAASGQSLFKRENQLLLAASYFDGDAEFRSVTELAYMDPLTRSTQGLGTGSFLQEGQTSVSTSTETFSLYFVNTLSMTDKLTLTLAGRFNSTDIRLRDLSGERPELNGDHEFSRFNPSLGFTYDLNLSTNIYASYSESNRVPTPIELACNEGVFTLAREYAELRGEDPDDIDFECRLPNAFLADPPLDDVLTRSLEAGVRGHAGVIAYQLGVFHTDNSDDILFQTTGRSTGLFANTDKTRRQGLELSLQGSVSELQWYANWTWLKATFESDFMVLSPNHPAANEEGELAVSRGNRMPGLPEHIIKLGADYTVHGNLTLGAELIYNSSQYLRGDESNQLSQTEAYALINLRAAYRLNDRLQAFARVSNLLDTDYENFGLLAEDPTDIISLTDARPVFLGVGAPRAAWLGLRYTF